MQPNQTGPAASPAAPAYVIQYALSFRAALEAARLLQARLYRRYFLATATGLLVGAVVSLYYPPVGLAIVGACAALLLMAKFAVMDRVYGRRQLRGSIGRAVKLALSDEGITWAGPLGSGRAPWTTLTEIRANGRTVLFVADGLLLAYAPAEAFATPGEQAEVIAYARRQVGEARAKPPGSQG